MTLLLETSLGATVLFRVRVPRTYPVTWTGARAIEHGQAGAIAEHHFDTEGPHVVAVVVEGAPGTRIEETAEFEVVRLRPTTPAPAGVLVSAIHVSADTVTIDPVDPNASSLEYFSRASSVAALRRLADDHYQTSINRRLRLQADIVPAAFAPLVEWRLDGRPQRDLGPVVDLEIYTADQHLLSAGPVADETQVRIDTYLVRITSHEPVAEILEGTPVTFTAVTEPPGYEEDVTWLAATRYGTADPWMGAGPEFTVVFEGTDGPEGRRLGVRADQPTIAGEAGLVESSILTSDDCYFRVEEEGAQSVPQLGDCHLCIARFACCALGNLEERIGHCDEAGLPLGLCGTLIPSINCSIGLSVCEHHCTPPQVIPPPAP